MRLGFILGEIGSGLRRNLSMVFSVILVTLVSLSFVGTAGLLQAQIAQMKGYWYDKVQVSIYLCNTNSGTPGCAAGAVTEEQRKNIENILGSGTVKPDVKSFSYESQQEALQHFREQFKNSPIIDSVTSDQLPSSYRVALVNPERFPVIRENFSSVPGVDQVVDQRQILEPFFNAMNIATIVSIGVAALMILCAWLLIATTIRLSAFSRRRETGIMRLVGASKAVIQLPFILEGVIAALIGAALAWVVTWAVAQFFIGGYLTNTFRDIGFISGVDVWWIGPSLVLIGIVLAVISSWLSLRKHLKV
ncbi:permease-like cell division protein FtsX [Psychromicrobium sp. YIM B11713]|uniref:permease-like cell division protein FtsX n=1 Tax=Psychromicrobium sp. YIM B11713 TaxID=3145233 RepID=UPI00374E4982